MAKIKAGTYAFNEALKKPATSGSLYGESGSTAIAFATKDGSVQYEAIKFIDTTLMFKVSGGDSITIYDFDLATWYWGIEGERYIVIATDQEVSDDFSTWFSANATLVETEGENPETPEKVIIKAGTYRFNDTLLAPSAPHDIEINFSYKIPVNLETAESVEDLIFEDVLCDRILAQPSQIAFRSFDDSGSAIAIPFYYFDDSTFGAHSLDKYIIVTEDTEVDVAFAEWFNSNTAEVTEVEPDDPDEPDQPEVEVPAPETVKDKILNLIKKANATTGRSDTDLTNAVNKLIAGYATIIEAPSEITANGTYTASQMGVDGISKVTVNVPNSPLSVEISTETEMTSLLETAEVGSVYKYVGESGAYENGALYIVEAVTE